MPDPVTLEQLMRWKLFRALAVGGAVVLSVALVGPAAGAVPVADPPTSPSQAVPPAGNDPYAVTLVTGDRVLVTARADGRRQLTVEPSAGRERVQFLQRSGTDAAGRERIQVVPVDAMALVAGGRLDARLFDISALIRLGYDDRSRSDVPLIVSYPDGIAARQTAIAGARTHRQLPSINGAALRTPKHEAGAFWASVTGSGPAGRSTAPSTAPSALRGGIARIWLDGRARLFDEASNTQIGVPTAAQAGFTGRGTTVAVLDSGIDATHPDVSGAVTEARDFTGAATGAADLHGHGTHVASIIAGSGGASAGRYRGVAPDAKLLVGKVCGPRFCDESDVLAGMEWAAGQRAKVINMSLGSDESTDGTDPLSAAVNNLTASAGSLFVIAAGNAGQPGTVGSPGAADAALTVASVGRTDALSGFSSRGPRIGDFALKPDLAAPGEGIVAARAAGTSMGTPVDERHTGASGTSMATPHVAGTAAILAQQHPDWTPAQLKSALMSTAKPIDATVYGQGAGRVDIGRAVTQPVRADAASVGFGFLRWPFAGGPAATRTVTYRNDGNAAVLLDLAVSATDPTGAAAAAGAFTVRPGTVTVPAGGTADVALTMNPGSLGTANVGSFGGRLVATGPGGVSVQTTFGVTTENESYDVTLKLIDRNGNPAGQEARAAVFFTLLDRTAGGTSPTTPPIVNGSVTVRAPKGEYGVTVVIITKNPGNPGFANASGTLAAVPRLVVNRNLSLTFDARRARRTEAIVDARGAARVRTDLHTNFVVQGSPFPESASVVGGAGNDMYTLPASGDPRVFTFGFQALLTAPGNGGPDRVYFLAIPVAGRIPADPRFRLRDRDLHRTDANYRAQGVDAAIADRVEFPFFLPGQFFSSNDFATARMPSRRLEFHSAGPRWSGAILQQYLPTGFKGLFEGSIELADTVYRAGRSLRQDWNRAAFNADLAPPNLANMVFRSGNTLRVNVSSYAPSEPLHTGSPVNNLFYVTGSATLSRDGAVIATKGQPNVNSFTLPADTGRYTLALSANRNRPWSTLSTRVNTTWMFTSTPPAAELERLPLPTVKTGGDFDGSNRARAGARFTLRLVTANQAGAAPAPAMVTSVEFSADDGVTWQPALLRHDGGDRWCAALTNPAAGQGSGFVSLRVRAINTAGNSVEHTTIRAYGLTA